MYQLYSPDIPHCGVVCGSYEEACAVALGMASVFLYSYWVIDLMTGEVLACFS